MTIAGYVDQIIGDEIIGWAADTNASNGSLIVEVIAGGSVVGIGLACFYREDLKAAGVGEGRHGFRIAIPYVPDGTPISCRVRGSNVELPRSQEVLDAEMRGPSSLISGSLDNLRPSRFALVVGNARSGTTIVGSLIDAHPRMICANESRASGVYWAGLSKYEIIGEIINNCEHNYTHQRPSSDYFYRIETAQKSLSDIDIIADKGWNPVLLLLHGDNRLLERLARTVDCEIALIHCIRNPFNVIATMHQRSGASLINRMRWYFMHCEAIQAIIEQAELNIHTIYHEELLNKPARVVEQLYGFLGHISPNGIMHRIKRVLFSSPHETRLPLDWPQYAVDEIRRRMRCFGFLSRYE
jgi:hypothetical protein